MVSVVADNVDTSKKYARKTGNLDNLGSIETLGQSSLNVTDVDNINEESIFVTLSKTDIAPDVTTPLAQPDHIKFESESASDNEKSQSKMIVDSDEKNGSESDDQSVRSFLLL